MVHFKITDGFETRRFQVHAGELTFEQLKEKIATLFPKAAQDISNLTLKYRDTDGDIITLSSDSEFQEVLSDLPENHVWKLRITIPHPQTERRGNPWSELEREWQELVNLFCGQHNSTPPSSEDKKTPATSEDNGQGETGTGETPQSGEDTGEGEEAKPQVGEDEEVKSKGGDEKKARPESTPSQCPLGGCCARKSVEVWEPLLFGGLLGSSMFSPRVHSYHITWSPRRSCTSTAAGSA